jgi:hypothetical protein
VEREGGRKEEREGESKEGGIKDEEENYMVSNDVKRCSMTINFTLY